VRFGVAAHWWKPRSAVALLFEIDSTVRTNDGSTAHTFVTRRAWSEVPSKLAPTNATTTRFVTLLLRLGTVRFE
jgi:hypothetical protein